MSSLGSHTLDCFRNGSVIQLKSKVTDKTLVVQEGSVINGNGNVGFYAGNLGPRTPIWGRWTDGTYHRGTISTVDSKVHIKFNDGDIISHDTSDKTAVLADVNPDPDAVQLGSRIIAQHRGSAKYYAGRVMKVDNANLSDLKFDIQFDDGDKGPATLHQMRLMPKSSEPISGIPSIVVHSRIIGRWTNNQYYRGVVTSVASKVDITFDDGDKIQHDPSDISAAIYDVNPLPGTIQVGARVIGFLPSINHFHLAKVVQVDYMNPQSPQFFVHFDNGEKCWCTLNDIRPVPLQRDSVGCVVWALWTNKLYYHGHVTDCSNGKIHILFDDGDKISHHASDISSVLIDVVPNPVSVFLGSRVIAAWPGQSRFYPGRISQIDATNCYAPRYHVLYNDGDKGWVNLDQIRLLAMKVNQVGADVWGRWTNNQYYKGRIDKVGSKIHILFDDGDRIAHSPSDVAAIILDTTPNNPAAVAKGSRVIAEWPNRSKLYPGTVHEVDKNSPYNIRYYIHYDDGDKEWVQLNQLKLIPVPGPSPQAQFSVVQIGGSVVALRNIAFPQYFLGVDGGQLIGKEFDNNCHFYVHETPDQYVSLELCMFPGHHVGVQTDGSMLPPDGTRKSDQAFFEVKLLFSPYGQTYQADHSHTASYPAPTPSYPSPYPRYPPPQGGGYPPAPYPPGQHPLPYGTPYPPPPGSYQSPGGYPGYGPPPPYQ